MSNPCERCGAEALPHERYCKRCRYRVLAELAASGYLTHAPRIGYTNRGPDHRQAKELDDSPWQQNNIRAMEDRDYE